VILISKLFLKCGFHCILSDLEELLWRWEERVWGDLPVVVAVGAVWPVAHWGDQVVLSFVAETGQRFVRY
jgi:hypothetical protein